MISKQFLITGIIWAIIGGLFSVVFRLQLGYPDQTFPFLEDILGHWAKGGKLDPEFYYALVTMHGTILVFFVLNSRVKRNFFKFLIPLQVGARDMASPFLNMLSYWFFFACIYIMFSSLFVQTGPASGGWTIYPPLSALGDASDGSKIGMDLWLASIGYVYHFSIAWWVKLYNYHIKYAYQRNEHDKIASYYMGIFLYCGFRCSYHFPFYYQQLYYCYLTGILEQVSF